MCDCYIGHCECCGRSVEIHVGDFSTGRNNVRVYCPKPTCQRAFLARLYYCSDETDVGQTSGWMVFAARKTEKSRGAWLFLVDVPRHIRLNE
jgi:hypothetical protein